MSALRPFDKLRVLSGSTALTILGTSKDEVEAQAQGGEPFNFVPFRPEPSGPRQDKQSRTTRLVNRCETFIRKNFRFVEIGISIRRIDPADRPTNVIRDGFKRKD
jgi:hypothetical protein